MNGEQYVANVRTNCRGNLTKMSPPQPKAIVRSALSVFFEYDTPKIVHIHSKKAGVINRLIQLVIIAYIVGFAIVWKKGYQEFADVEGAVTTKLKGVELTSDYTNTTIPNIPPRIWDVGDYVVPPQENGAFFVMTNVIVTPQQFQGTCEEDPSIDDAKCTNRTHTCVKGDPVISGNGVKTGECINSTLKTGVEVCEIQAWCPVEFPNSNHSYIATLGASENFTVFIKNNIEFPKFGVMRRNFPEFATDDYLATCRYNPSDPRDQYCPIFTLNSIAAMAGHSYSAMVAEGGVIQIVITWDCNLDNSVDNCLPEYSFRRLDRGDFKISKGFNFRYAEHYKLNNGTMARTLYKAFGIRFIITVQGQAGKFAVVPLLLNVASGLALLSIATILCDIIVLYILKARKFFRDSKYQDVKGSDAYEILGDDNQSEANDGVRQRRTTNSSSVSDKP